MSSASVAPSPRERNLFSRPQEIKGRFKCAWTSWHKPGLLDVLKWKVFETNEGNPPKLQELEEALPILTPDFKPPADDSIRVTWIGHATALIQMENVTILTDPVFSSRVSPSFKFWSKTPISLPVPGTMRYRAPPCEIEDLPVINAVVISHDHYDHLDYSSVCQLNERYGKSLHWYVPFGLKKWMHSAGCENVKEMCWWDIEKIPGTEVNVVFTPCQHWCQRGLFDFNKVLWGSWCVIGPKKRFFYAGDTGYCDVFKLIGNMYGPFDLAAIPIGAYEPVWFMQCQHVKPEQSVQIHKDIRARYSVGVHWGTFVLAYEPYLRPKEQLEEAIKANNLQPDEFFTLRHGESKTIT